MKSLPILRDFLSTRMPPFVSLLIPAATRSGCEASGGFGGRYQWTMWLFAILVSLGLAFMVYAPIQFSRDGKRKPGTSQGDPNLKTGDTQPRNLVEMNSPQDISKPPSSKTRTAKWSHGNGEIEVRSVGSDGHVVLRRIRASRRRTGCSPLRSTTGK